MENRIAKIATKIGTTVKHGYSITTVAKLVAVGPRNSTFEIVANPVGKTRGEDKIGTRFSTPNHIAFDIVFA